MDNKQTPWTPGPWTISGKLRPEWILTDPKFPDMGSGEPIAIAFGDDKKSANAHLIAAAPELYAALDAFLSMYIEMANSGDCGFWNVDEDVHVIAARAALAKARGEST